MYAEFSEILIWSQYDIKHNESSCNCGSFQSKCNNFIFSVPKNETEFAIGIWNNKQKNNINSIRTTRYFLVLSQTVLLKCKQFVRYFKSQFVRNNFSFNSNWIPVTEQFNFINIWLFIRSKNLTTFCLMIRFDWFSYSWLLWLFRVGVKLLSMRFYC